MKRLILLFVILFLIQSFPQTRIESLRTKINSLLENDFFKTTNIALQIHDLNSDRTIYSKNTKLLLNPASNMKLLTTAAAIEFYGDDLFFSTQVYYTGEILFGSLKGDLYIAGGLDPDFTLADMDSLASQLKRLNIRKIEGNICGDISIKDSLFWGIGWMWDDDLYPDAPFLSALNINDNIIEVAVKSSFTKSKPEIEIYPPNEFIRIRNEAFIDLNAESTYVEITRDWLNRSNDVIVKGIIKPLTKNPETVAKRKLNLFSPERVFINFLIERLKQNGITVNGKANIKNVPFNSVKLFSYERPFTSVIDNLNKESDNLSAEMTFYLLGERFFGKPSSSQKGIEAIKKFLKLIRLNPENYVIADGSGVSRYNLITAECLIEILKYMYKKGGKTYETFLNSLPVAGVDGTLTNRMKNRFTLGNVKAKTGTLQGVSCLSGYLKTKNQHDIAFSILIQNFIGSPQKARGFQDEICRLIVENY
ncbi:MAG: D-alanyl-D-alanine carboxypeptidase/D-alanyl-D-alanine-endopeptidase [Ignavibacteriaceae bacterium]|nr:D-alanyl-D-alanine carboxypeptidase/D-alanyl-D-alanine-endopeptidase [Ignavibacteriaceae bacterium]